MDRITASADNDFNVALYGTLWIAALSLIWFTCRADPEEPVKYVVETPEQAEKGWKGEVLENPGLKVSGSHLIQCYAPATGEALGRVNPSTADGIDRAIEKAKAAQVKWAETSFLQRRKVLRTMLKFILENQEAIARVACLDSGKTMVDASLGEILVTVEKLRWTIKHGEKSLKAEKRDTNFLMIYPFHNLISPVIASIFAGNAIIVKGSEATAWSSSYFASIATQALKACGHPPDIVQSVVCWPDVADHLTSHPEVSHITFIGSRPVAHHVCASAAKALIPVCVELGGKDPAIVLDDLSNSDFKRVASILMRGTFQSAGQNCIGIERVIALPNVYDRLIEYLTPKIRALRPGSILNSSSDTPIDIGASISDASYSKLEDLIQDAVKNGARLLVGGKQYAHPDFPKGHYFTPTFIADVTPSMKIAQTELFAPVFLLMRAESVTDAITIANSTSYALGSSVFGSSNRDLELVVRSLHAGMVAVNDFAVYYMVQMPFGGTKGSGYGRFAGKEGLRSLCNQKSITRDRWAWAGIKTGIPPPMDIPLNGAGAGEKAWNFAQGIVWLGYGDLRGKTRGLKGLMGMK
ncbi:PutA NAD-dependent aldehyde dehydrogenase [Pyrenophora tritici-repentis]|uniref:aldehyde dehydrogenase (NAD(+)) n=1 Tax=Pyrenophora tritici-repentis TaxID=45151 RepID=A0A2W1F5I9_9PLEO|nr:PutA NAD-dependent aldehyde dehydrogenase [Pyrenophora tritici-repentis]KAF7571058.1 PutA, NAD-dependent aldehyde dehydrogenase [Pyrenophora tritici-repentis]KAI0579145.1 PutA NAD-dependent aldehyde dehydrogenase [Pyrenophora tritici-repentis]KAI0580324.1 PutA NAD-dependent aldehyde dehydrogenase [Pyrenophora tritici-repentis]KAI0608677.1 PutA NAD-dependent aldehyde dehydrogenase [Pyrenophora tritici-repentis]